MPTAALSDAESARPANPAQALALVATVPAGEWDESGLHDMAQRWAAVSPSGEVIGMAGYERWGDHLAHPGIAVAPAFRGQGVAGVVARAAVSAALREGRVVQWRSRLVR